MRESVGNAVSLQDLLLYRELKAEHDEILRHKWFESEKAGRDVGFDLAVIDWKLKHSSGWRRQRRVNSFCFHI